MCIRLIIGDFCGDPQCNALISITDADAEPGYLSTILLCYEYTTSHDIHFSTYVNECQIEIQSTCPHHTYIILEINR
jgi:hypothetical protein